MSRIDDLIEQLCPNGVTYRAIREVVDHGTTIRWPDVVGEKFQYIDLTSVDRVTHAISHTETITSADAPSRAQQVVREDDVIFGTTRPTLKRYAAIPTGFDGQICSTGYCVLRPRTDRILSGFLFHLLGTSDFHAYIEAHERGASYPAISDSVVKEFRIPLPPLAAQSEIIRVLDTFQELEAELEAELKAELEARRRQYAQYRDALLSFGDLPMVRWTPMGELGQIFRGKRFTKADYVDEGGVGCIHYGEIYTDYGTSAAAVVSRLRSELAPTLRFATNGDVVLTDVGETVEDVGKAVAWLGSEDVAVHDHCYVFRSDMNPVFVSHYMQTTKFRADKNRHIARTKVKTLLPDGLRKIHLPVPSAPEQERIVAILDAFDALVNNLSVGLLAELSARRQQYAHYRNQMLSFAEAL